MKDPLAWQDALRAVYFGPQIILHILKALPEGYQMCAFLKTGDGHSSYHSNIMDSGYM